MSAFVVGLVGQFGKKELLAVYGEYPARESAGIDIPSGNGDNDAVSAFAIEFRILHDERIAIGAKQFYAVDELKVLAKDGNLLASFDAFAGLL